MTRSLSAVAGVAALLAAALLFQGRVAAAENRMDLLKRLDGHIGAALPDSSLADNKARELADARKVITGLASQRRLRDQYERDDLNRAMKVVQGVFKDKKSFKNENDRKAVLDDLDRIKKSGLLSNPSAQKRNTRMPRSPNPFPRTRMPRRW